MPPPKQRPGPGRGHRVQDRTVTRSISIRPALLAALDAWAETEGVSRSEAVERLLSGLLLDPDQKIEKGC